ncbi:uncharacterized protein LOC111014575 [Momordica charantia]|uniref:Uncharacterized protein LOC111014575 n=1 Tax=Momordica charantia TaxID=3673 RepID=A0A6J1CV90_MOMCH|nr:uncharacterized protein LOC111014575 [Momordica charantia]
MAAAGKIALVLGFALFVFLLQNAAAQTVHIVGDATGWAAPQNGADFYAKWAAGKKFVVGDSLVFNFTGDDNDVAQVTKVSFDSCSDDDEIGDDFDHSPATIVLKSPGEHYFICTNDRRCVLGQKMAINVSAASGPAAPKPAGPPSATPVPGKTPVTHVVGDAAGWAIPKGGAAFYATWAAGKTFTVGDSLVFNFATNAHDVVRVPKASFDACSDDDEIGRDIEISPATVLLSIPGEYYFISSKDGQCQQGMKLAINVTGAAASGPAAPPTTTRPAPPVSHIVGDATGWSVPQGDPAFYAKWAAGKTFAVGDSLVFNFRTDVHDVERVPKASFDVCSDDNEIGESLEIGPATVFLSTPGEYYFICTKDGHCLGGQKLAINVTATRSTSAANSPGGSPSTGAGGPQTASPPGSSANAVAAALSVTLLGVVMSLF